MSDTTENENVETPTTAPSEDVSGLKSKVRELMGKLKDANEALDTANNANLDDLTKAQNRIRKLEGDLADANGRASKSEEGLRSYMSQADITKAFATSNVDTSKHGMILTSHFKGLVEYDDEGKPHIAGKSIEDYAKAFFAGEGKSYTLPANNNGGSAQGNDGSETVEAMNEPKTSDEYLKFYALPEASRAALATRWGNDALHPNK